MGSFFGELKRRGLSHSSTRYSCLLIVVCLGLATLSYAAAQALLPVPPLIARVTDLTETLDANQRQTLESKLATLERRKGAQIGVLIVGTTRPEDIAQYGIRVFDTWKLGRQGVNDGVLLLVAKTERNVRIEVGRGLEGAIPDAATARIIREYIAPKFRADDFYGGIEAATGVLTSLIDGEQLPAPTKRIYVDLPPIAVFGFFFVFLTRLFFGRAALQIRAPVMMCMFAAPAWYLTQVAGKSLTYSLLASTAYAILAFLSALIPSFMKGVPANGNGNSGDNGFSDSGSSSNSANGGSSSSSSSSDSGGSFSGGGGESAGGGASGNW